jgi:hypothetical protein
MSMNTAYRWPKWLITALVIELLVGHISPGLAIDVETQNHAALQIQPAITELSVERGSEITALVAITNQTSHSMIINTLAEKLELAPGTVSGPEEIFNASSWVTVATPQFALQSGETRKVVVGVHPPDTAEPGSHYATLYFSALLPRESLAPNTALQTARVGSLLFINVGGARVVQVVTSRPLSVPPFLQGGPVELHFALQNTGNTHTLPSGTLRIRDYRGNTVWEQAVPPGLILPKTTKDYRMVWPVGLVLGHYTAELVMSYGSEHNPLSGSAGFWVAPVWYMLGVLLGFILLVWFILATRRRWSRAVRVFFSRRH